MGNCCCKKTEQSIEENYSGISELHTNTSNLHVNLESDGNADDPNSVIMIALYDYNGRNKELSFRKGDLMRITDDSDGDWFHAVHLGTKKTGFIPGNYVAPENSLQSKDWFFSNLNRKEAEELLLSRNNSVGAFLVRPSEHNIRGYSLSVKDLDSVRGSVIKHYKILPLDGGGFYITKHRTFGSVSELVKFYSVQDYGLCHVLTQPCKKPTPDRGDLSYDYKKNWEIMRDELELLKKIGEGNFGQVYYGKWANQKDVAIKTLKTGSMSTEAFLTEASIMKTVQHKNLVLLYGVCTQEEPIFIVQEYVCHGSLLFYLRDDEGRQLTFEDLIYISFQIASGMMYLESKKLIHRDLAARNVLVGENLVAKICDFGLARVFDEDYCSSQNMKFPVKWTALEAISHRRFSIKSDVWSFGIVLMEIFTYGGVPYPGMSGTEVIEALTKGYRMPQPASFEADNLYDLMLLCWHVNPQKRPTFEFLTHYFESYKTASEQEYKDILNSIER